VPSTQPVTEASERRHIDEPSRVEAERHIQWQLMLYSNTADDVIDLVYSLRRAKRRGRQQDTCDTFVRVVVAGSNDYTSIPLPANASRFNCEPVRAQLHQNATAHPTERVLQMVAARLLQPLLTPSPQPMICTNRLYPTVRRFIAPTSGGPVQSNGEIE
jgi:hypothetical protein